MELNMYLTGFVLTMCAVDLVWSAGERISTWWNEKIRSSAKSAAIAEKRDGRPKAQAPQRSDWYAFFHCSDLVGCEPHKQENIPAEQSRPAQRPASTPSADKLRRSPIRSGARLTLS